MITAAYHFDKGARVQNLLHSIKYDGNKEAARFVGTWYGNELLQSELADADLIVPVPLHPSKLKSRGYNQSEEFGAGLSESMKIPMAARALRRVRKGDTQTKRGREERWSNVKDVFAASEPEVFYGKHVLVVDDVLTTGATLEACVKSIPSQSYRALSVATIAGVRKG
jgi:ComF family protein